MFKTFMVALGIVAVMSVLVANRDSIFNSSLEVMKIDKEVIEREVTPDWASDVEAVEAAKAVIRKKELTAQSEALAGQIEALKAQKTEVDKELGTF